MATKRKSLSKKIRFEVFKRDKFMCQYCGASAPNVELVVDHIAPVSKGGEHDIMNFITACQPCNAGKSDRELGDNAIVKKQKAQLDALSERREQIDMMLKWRDGLKEIQTDQIDVVCSAWKDKAEGYVLNDFGRVEVKKMLNKHGLIAVLEAIEESSDAYLKPSPDPFTPEDVNKAWHKVGGFLKIRSMPDDRRRLYYIKGILKNRFGYVEYDILSLLEQVLENGILIDDIERESKSARNLRQFKDWIYERIA